MAGKRTLECLCFFAAATALACKPRPLTNTAPDAGRPCLETSACAADEYCAFKPRLCGASSKAARPGYEVGLRPGICSPRPASCNDSYGPVCGCDKRVYASECVAELAGVDLNVNDGCFENSPRDWISCGERFCSARTQYCEMVLSDVFELPTDYACKPLPPACVPDAGAARSCDCFPKGTRCLDWCGTIVSGEHGLPGFHLTCRL
jgi:hypothetical protein